MPAVPLRTDFDAAMVRGAATTAKDPAQVRRLLAVAAVYDGVKRHEAATVGGRERRTLRDWGHRFNAEGAAALVDRKAPGAARRLTPAQFFALAEIVETGPDPETDGVVRWRRIDLQAVIKARFGVDAGRRNRRRHCQKREIAYLARPTEARTNRSPLGPNPPFPVQIRDVPTRHPCRSSARWA